MRTDPISDFINRMKNASRAGSETCSLPGSKMKKAIADVLVRHNFIADAREEMTDNKKTLTITFKNDRPKLDLKRISKPGQRRYESPKNMKRVKSGLGAGILSTSRGILTDREAKKMNIGGEYLFTIY